MDYSKFTTCKTCGKEIAKTAKVCPHCGAPVKKKFYQRIRFWFTVTVLAGGACFYGCRDKFLKNHKNIGKIIKKYSKKGKKRVKLPWKK